MAKGQKKKNIENLDLNFEFCHLSPVVLHLSEALFPFCEIG